MINRYLMSLNDIAYLDPLLELLSDTDKGALIIVNKQIKSNLSNKLENVYEYIILYRLFYEFDYEIFREINNMFNPVNIYNNITNIINTKIGDLNTKIMNKFFTNIIPNESTLDIYYLIEYYNKKEYYDKLGVKLKIFSFALKPENHQPSGFVNFSRMF